jgi:hypothetical protein
MDLQRYETTSENFPKTSQFTSRLETQIQVLDPMLEDFKKYYVFYNINPENSEYQRMFENIKNNLNSANSNLFTLSNDAQGNINNINNNLSVLYSDIQKEKDKNIKLKKSLGITEHKNDAANIMISNYVDIYNTGYTRNWAIFLSTVAVGIAISKFYKQQ